jgi:hypothetical protein
MTASQHCKLAMRHAAPTQTEQREPRYKMQLVHLTASNLFQFLLHVDVIPRVTACGADIGSKLVKRLPRLTFARLDNDSMTSTRQSINVNLPASVTITPTADLNQWSRLSVVLVAFA